MKTESRIESVTVAADTVWDLIGLYEDTCKRDPASIIALEALAQLLVDTPIGEDIADVWYNAKGSCS